MDIPCNRCGEPWDNDSFHEEAAESNRTYQEVIRDFQAQGCNALAAAFGPSTCQPANANQQFRAEVAGAMMELCGDDMDGVASLMDDFDYMGVFE